MFRGSPGLSADQLAEIGAVMGGNFNANTRESLTQYLFTVPADDLDVALHIEAARMQGVIDADKEWDRERGAIEQEVAQDFSQPSYVLYEKIREALFAGTPYEHVALGTRPSFDKTTGAMLQKFHNAWYAPNNAIVIVVGDIDPNMTLATIKQLFGGLKPKKLPQRPNFVFRPVTLATFTLDTDRPEGTELIAFRMPGLDSPDFPALEVLADVISNHRFDLYGLVPAGKALETNFGVVPLRRASVGYAEVSFTQGTDPKQLESEVNAILAHVAQSGVSADLVAAAKLQEERQSAFEKNSIADLTSDWADAVALYGLKAPDDDLARIEKVTVADVNRAASKYLDVAHAVAAIAMPKGSGRPASTNANFGGQETISLGEAKAVQLPEWTQSALNRLEVPPSTTSPIVTKLANGLTLIVQPETVSDTVSIFGHVKNRPETEAPKGEEGVASVLNALFPYGTETRDRLVYREALDSIGAEEVGGPDFGIEMLSRDLDKGAELLAENELHPALPAQAMQIVQQQVAQLAGAQNASPGHLAQRSLSSALFTPSDPSVREATPETVASLTLDKVREYYSAVYRPDLTTIVVIGNVSPDAARTEIEKYFGGWHADGPPPQVDLPVEPPNSTAVIAVPDDSRVQDNVFIAQSLSFNRQNPDYYALELGNAVLGGGFYSTRLSIDLRKNSGLVYSVSSRLQSGRTRSVYYIQYACDPQNVSRAGDIVSRELANMQSTPVGLGELIRAKALLLRQIPLAESSVDDIARGFLDRADLGLPMDEPTIAGRKYVELDAAAVQMAFQKWMRPKDLVRVSQGPPPG